MKIGTTSKPASWGDTPPSSDSGVHSLGEQWENMSTSYIEMEPEQNDRPTNGSPRGRNVSDNRVPPNTEDDEDIPTVGDRKDNRGRRMRIGSDKDISSDTDSNLFDRLVKESATAWAGLGGILMVQVENIGNISAAR